MSILSRLFRKTDSGMNGEINGKSMDKISEVETPVNIMEDLFVNSTPPKDFPEQKTQTVSLENYLKQDFAGKGYEDGYNYHSHELLENKIKQLKADFRLTVDLKLDQIRQEILKCQDHKIDIEGMSERLVQQIDNRINSLRELEKRLEAEKGRSAMDEGLVMNCIHSYRDGFFRGTEAFLDEKDVVSCTGLFN